MSTPQNRGRREAVAASVPPPVKKSPVHLERRQHALAIAAIWAVALLAYSNSFGAGLVVDSAARITQDPRVHHATRENINLILRSDYWHPALGSGLYRPLTTLSFLFNYAVLGGGANPFAYHLVNSLLHALNIALVYLLAWRLLRDVAAAIAIGALWAVHPVLTESVTNIVGRADMLAGIGVLGGLLCYLESTKAEGWRRSLWLGSAALAAGAGVFSKESAVVVLGVVALYELACGAGGWRARVAGYTALALPCLLYWLVRRSVFANGLPMYVPFTDNPMIGADFFTARWTAIKVIGKQMLLLLWPAQLACDYSYNQIPLSFWSDWKAWTALGACLAATATAVIAWRRSKPLFFWIAFFFLTLAPTSNIAVIIGTPMAERFLYLPAIGFIACAVMAVRAATHRAGPRVFYAAIGVIGIALAVRTYARNPDWKDEATTWARAVEVSPASYKTHLSVSNTSTKLDAVLAELDASMAIVNHVPDEIGTTTPFLNAGQRYREKGDLLMTKVPGGPSQPTPQSTEWHRKSLELLLRAERIQGSYDRKNRLRMEQMGQTFVPPWTRTHTELGRTYSRLGDFDRAVEAVRSSAKRRFSPEDFEQLSVLYFRMGKPHDAAIALLEALVVQPENTKIAGEVVSLYAQTDPQSCATRTVNGAPALNLECPLVHDHLCRASLNVARMQQEGGRPAVALQTVRTAADRLRCNIDW